MDLNSKEFTSGFEINNSNDNKLKLLENKILIYQKEIQSLKSKIKILQEDNDDKNLKIQEQLNHLLNLENDNNSLKKLYDNSKQKFNNESNTFLNNKRVQEQEINNMKLIIGELKSENEKLSKSLIIQNKENSKLQQNLMKTVSENKLYSKDNTILLSKVKEYEDNIFMLNSDNDMNKIANLNGKNKSEFINNVNSMYENKLALYSSIINDEINIIAKYIDTYMNLNLMDDIKINIPLLQNITNFPKDNKLSSFWNIINAVENALKRIISQNKIIKNNEMLLKQEINKLNNFLEQKNNENLELKKNFSEMKKNLFYLKNDYDKLKNDLSSQKGFNKEIQDTMNEINNSNDEYLKGLYNNLKKELDNIINEPLFNTYVNIILEQKNNAKNDYNSGLKYLFSEILDKYILVNNFIIDDFKKQKSQKEIRGFNRSDYENNSSNIQRLEVVIDELNNRIMEKDKIISNDKDEKKLLINQINILQRDIFNLKHNNMNILKNDNSLNNDNNSDYQNMNINEDYLQKEKRNIINKKINEYDNINMNNNLNNNYNNQIIGNNAYINSKKNMYMNNNINKEIPNNIKMNINKINKNPQMINNNYNINNENDFNNINNEEMKDNQTEDVEENEIYFEGQQFPNPEVFNELNNYDQYNQGMYDNMNNGQNEIENEEEEYKDEQEMEDYNNLYQFHDIIEEEENENNTVEESNKNKSLKNSNIYSNKSNVNNNINFDNANSQIDKIKNINLNQGNEGQINKEFNNNNKN